MKNNIFSGIPDNLPEEFIEKLVQSPKLSIERIVSRGHISSKWYDQNTDEFVLLVSGEASLRFEDSGELIGLKPGDWLNIPAHRRHKVECTLPERDTVWLAVHY